MPFWAYLLRCSDGSFYAGHTDALEHRIGQHQIGRGSDYTARRQPVSLVWCQDFPSRLEAERRIKGWSRAKKEALIAGDWERVSQLAVAYGARPSTGSGRTELDLAAPSPVRPELVEGRAKQTEQPCP
ncbi:GIY-YIG nuclease family protein [Sphingomonas sp. OV641]|uniref:GIY-YIG nuclease family protein n=1 Tax=Sphingomonas sp. OV641 TaxID=1881068 RepID=UPI000AA0A827|nr:GIY-YIG nuclease family protein [Sphingomonas sp. OV641]